MTDVATQIHEAIKSFGGNDSQAEDAALVLLDQCATVGGIVTLSATGAAITDPKSKAWLEEHKPHLLPRKFERSLADRAFLDGNISARGTLLREVGEVEATRIAQSYGLKSLHDTARGTRPADAVDGSEKKAGTADHSKNPWGRNFNVTRQGQLVKALGVDKAAALARSVGSHIGAVRPNIAYLDSIGA